MQRKWMKMKIEEFIKWVDDLQERNKKLTNMIEQEESLMLEYKHAFDRACEVLEAFSTDEVHCCQTKQDWEEWLLKQARK